MADTVTHAPRVIGYLRVSTDEQAESGLGLDAQRHAILDECARRGWQLVDVVQDPGWSSATLDRPALTDALARLEKRRADADVLLVSRLDRLTRSWGDLGDLLKRAKRHRWSVVALDLGVDTTTPTGEAVAGFIGVAAQLERRLIGERTRAALAAKKARGERLGRPRAVPLRVVARIAADRRAGASLSAIARALNEDAVPTAHGGARWYPSTVRAVIASHAATP